MVVSVCRTMCAYLQVSVGTCPRQHTIPSCGSDTIGACDAVSDVVGEACDCHGSVCVCVCVCVCVSRPRVSLGIPDADHGEGDKDGG